MTACDLAGTVLSLWCRFCLKCGPQASSGAKRKRTSNVHMFRRPFRTDDYKKHYSSARCEIWSRFLGCSVEERAMFFNDHVNYAGTLLPQFESEGPLILIFNHDVADVIIGGRKSDEKCCF